MLRVRQEPAEDANTDQAVNRKGKVMAKKTKFDGIIVKSAGYAHVGQGSVLSTKELGA